MLFHFDRRKKSEKEKKPPRFLVLRRKWLTLGAAVLAAAAIFAAVNYPAAVSASATTRQLPIYCVQRDQKVCSISFDAAWGADNTQKILDVLKEYGVTCTFFVVGNWADQYPEQAKAIVAELKKYDEALYNKPRWLVLNKLDMIPAEERAAKVKDFVKRYKWKGPVYEISALAREGTERLVQDIFKHVHVQQQIEQPQEAEYDPRFAGDAPE